MKPPTVFGLREQGAMLLAVERLANLPAPPVRLWDGKPGTTRWLLREVALINSFYEYELPS